MTRYQRRQDQREAAELITAALLGCALVAVLVLGTVLCAAFFNPVAILTLINAALGSAGAVVLFLASAAIVCIWGRAR